MIDINYEMIEMRFFSNQMTPQKTVEKTSTSLRLVPNTFVSSGIEENFIVVPNPIFEFFCSLIENGKVASVNSLSATLKDGSAIFSEDV
ncbi:MAG: hypothetical protein AB9861_16705 [Methanosarcina sp.]|jgi:hypothetical protein